jgi:hypothetical protein
MRLLLPAGSSIARRRTIGLMVSLAAHLALAAFLTLRQPAEGAAGDGERSTPLVVMTVSEDEILLPDPPNAESAEVDVSPDEKALVVDEFTFDIEKIRRRRRALFPYLTSDVLFVDQVIERSRVAPDTLVNPLGRARDPNRPPLIADASQVQRFVDSAWARRDRWTRFAEIASLLERHDADAGRAAEVVHQYLDQNLLQPYEDAQTRDSKYWVMMELVSDHVDFIDFIRSYARNNPSSRATTELLFLLDELAEASYDSMLMLLDTDPPTELTTTFALSRDAYGLAVNIGAYYRQWLIDHRVTSPAALRARYEDQRLRILSAILASAPGGYRSGDARFLIGQIQFGRKEYAAAADTWAAIVPDESDNYYPVYSAILAALAEEGDRGFPRIAAALGGHYLRWREFSRERLRAFGYEFNTF